MFDELKSCPFCGEMPESGVDFYESSGTKVKLAAIVHCKKCGTEKRVIFEATTSYNNLVSFEIYMNAFESVLKLWNRRISDADSN